ncbi:MAG: hypothetical protein QOF36_875, partial [Microbacteriaceae bacterium]|nr:hypothetical protein [Microbacteriaceae bacterium]
MISRTFHTDSSKRSESHGLARWTSVAGIAALASAVLVGGGLSAPSRSDAAVPDLGAAASYSVLGGSTVTNTGPTVLNGDLGVSPGTAITGFPPGITNGATHAGDAQAAQAKLDLLTAYNAAAALTP